MTSCPLSRYFGSVKPKARIILSPTRPPLRACPDTTLAGARVVPGQTARCPPPRPRGACKQNQAAHEIARGHQASLRSAWSPLAHYAPLDRAQSAHLRYTSFRSVTSCPLSRYFGSVKPKARIILSPTRPPLRACPDTTLAGARVVPGQTARCPPPRPRGACKQTKTLEKKQNTCRAPRSGGPGPHIPQPPRPRCSARACFAINTIMNK